MFAKRIQLVLFLIISLPFSSISQTDSQETIAKFIIADAKKNGLDRTPWYLENDAYTVFYTSGEDGLYMANVMPKSNTQSYGPLYGVQSEMIEETYDNYEADFYYFNWSYSNSYNEKTGTAKVILIKIYKPQGVAFTIKIITESLDVIVFKGYMEGTVDFSIYE